MCLTHTPDFFDWNPQTSGNVGQHPAHSCDMVAPISCGDGSGWTVHVKQQVSLGTDLLFRPKRHESRVVCARAILLLKIRRLIENCLHPGDCCFRSFGYKGQGEFGLLWLRTWRRFAKLRDFVLWTRIISFVNYVLSAGQTIRERTYKLIDTVVQQTDSSGRLRGGAT